MIYRFKIVSDEVNNFSRIIEADSEATFFDLRNAILESVEYSKDNLDSFFICDDDWQKEQEVTQMDMGTSSDQDIWIMADTPLSELIEEEGQRLMFVFDYLSDRAFFMELKVTLPGENLDTPRCIQSAGTPPQENIDLDDFEKNIDAIAGSTQGNNFGDDEFDFGDDLYNDDDLDNLQSIEGLE